MKAPTPFINTTEQLEIGSYLEINGRTEPNHKFPIRKPDIPNPAPLTNTTILNTSKRIFASRGA